jgi:hypothetical protein
VRPTPLQCQCLCPALSRGTSSRGREAPSTPLGRAHCCRLPLATPCHGIWSWAGAPLGQLSRLQSSTEMRDVACMCSVACRGQVLCLLFCCFRNVSALWFLLQHVHQYNHMSATVSGASCVGNSLRLCSSARVHVGRCMCITVSLHSLQGWYALAGRI